MKIRNILALVALGCMLALASCKKEDKAGSLDHMKIIPANSAMVMSINAKTLVEKGGLNDYKNFELYKKFHGEIAKYEPEMGKIIDEFLKDTRSTGLNLDQIFVYLQPKDRYDMLATFVFSVDDQDKVGKWIASYHKATHEDEYELEKGEGYQLYRLDRRNLLVWDKTKALLLNVRDYEEEDLPSFETLLKVDEENSIVSNADFMECYNAQKDFTFWMPFKSIGIMGGNEDATELSTLKKFYGEDWDKASMSFSLDFTNEKAALSISVWPSNLVDKYLGEHPILKENFDQSLLSYFPKDYLFTSKLSFNVQEYYKMMTTNLNKLAEDLKKDADEDEDYEIDEYYGYYPFSDYSYISKILSMLASDDVAKIVNSFKGDVVADIFGFQEGMIPMPQFGVIVTINGEDAFNHLLGLLPEEVKLTKNDSYYSYNIPFNLRFFKSSNITGKDQKINI